MSSSIWRQQNFLDTAGVETLLREVRAYTDGLCAALEDMRSALQEAAE